MEVGDRPRTGELLRSVALGVTSFEDGEPVSLISFSALFGRPGNTSSTGLLGVRTRLGDSTGLEGRLWGEMSS